MAQRLRHLADAMIIYNRFETHGLPDSADYIRSFFSDLKHVTLSAMLLKPGNYIPQHWDLYGAYRKVFDVKDASIMRAMIMLEDGVPGQIFQLGSDTITDWHAGDVFSWHDQTVHATYNFSMVNRYAVQVTGVCQ